MSRVVGVRLARFVTAGLMNTAIGATAIFVFLRLGWGDYRANLAGYLVGLVASYLLNSRWVFADRSVRSKPEALRFGLSAGVAYTANLGVVHAGRQWGYIDNPLTHAAGIAVYAAVFFLLSQCFVFRSPPAKI